MTFTQIAAAYSSGIESIITRHCENMEWQQLLPPPGLSLPAMPGMAIKAAIQQLRLPRVSHVAISNEMAPYGLYGIRCHYSNGTGEIFLLDIGTQTLVLCHRLLDESTAKPASRHA